MIEILGRQRECEVMAHRVSIRYEALGGDHHRVQVPLFLRPQSKPQGEIQECRHLIQGDSWAEGVSEEDAGGGEANMTYGFREVSGQQGI